MTAAARPATRRKRAIWRDPQGRFSWLKLLCFALLFLPGLVLAVQWATDSLGARPVTEVIHGTGFWTYRLLLITLAVSPLALLLDWPRLLLLRRMLGVACTLYGLAHLSLYALDEGWDLPHVASEIVLRFYLTLGFVALLGLSALAITSTDGWMRRLRRNWSRLHSLVYPIAIIGLWHFALQAKSNVSEPVLMTGFAAWLLGWRLLPRRWRGHPGAAFALALVGPLVAALAEAGWYWGRNRVDPLMVLGANLDISFGLRPAVWDLVALLGLALLIAGRRAWRRRLRLAAT